MDPQTVLDFLVLLGRPHFALIRRGHERAIMHDGSLWRVGFGVWDNRPILVFRPIQIDWLMTESGPAYTERYG